MEKLQGGDSGAGIIDIAQQLSGPHDDALGENDSAMKMVQELAGWMEQDDNMHVWMPTFDTLGGLGEYLF